MKHLVIIGARGYGREIFNFAHQCKGFGTEFDIKGFLDDKSTALDDFEGYAPILNSVEDYQIENDDVFTCALGEVKYKIKYCKIILEKGGSFINLISNDAYIGMNVKMGIGCIICPTARVHCDVSIGDFVTLQPFCVLGHDVKMGSWCHVNDYADCGGATTFGDNVTIHTHSFVLPKFKVGNNVTIGAGSIVLRNVPDNMVMFGNPAKPLPLPNSNK